MKSTTLFHTSQSLQCGPVVYLWIRLHLWLSLGKSCETKEMTWNSILWPRLKSALVTRLLFTWLGLSFSPQRDTQNQRRLQNKSILSPFNSIKQILHSTLQDYTLLHVRQSIISHAEVLKLDQPSQHLGWPWMVRMWATVDTRPTNCISFRVKGFSLLLRQDEMTVDSTEVNSYDNNSTSPLSQRNTADLKSPHTKINKDKSWQNLF